MGTVMSPYDGGGVGTVMSPYDGGGVGTVMSPYDGGGVGTVMSPYDGGGVVVEVFIDLDLQLDGIFYVHSQRHQNRGQGS